MTVDELCETAVECSRSLDSSHSITSPQSSSHSSQDSLHRSTQQMQPSHSGMGMMLPRGKKKAGIKSSLGRIFSKKEKGRKDLYMSGGRGELTADSDLRLAVQDSTSISMTTVTNIVCRYCLTSACNELLSICADLSKIVMIIWSGEFSICSQNWFSMSVMENWKMENEWKIYCLYVVWSYLHLQLVHMTPNVT